MCVSGEIISVNFSAQWNFWHIEIFHHIDILPCVLYWVEALNKFGLFHQLLLPVIDQSLFSLDLQASLMSLLSYFQAVPRDLVDPVGALSSELLSSAIAEANAAVKLVQQAKAKDTKKRGAYIIEFDEKTKTRIESILAGMISVAAMHFSKD